MFKPKEDGHPMNTNTHLDPTAQVSYLCDVKPPDKITWLKTNFLIYFIPKDPTSALTSSRKDVKQLVYFQILQNADKILLFSVNSAVILFSKVCWFTASIVSCN